MAKSKGIVLDSTLQHGAIFSKDSKARHKLETLMRDYMELQKEVNVMKRNLEAADRRKMVVSSEVRFLRRRYMQLAKVSTPSVSLPENTLWQMRDSGCNDGFRKQATKRIRYVNKQVDPQHTTTLQCRKKVVSQLGISSKVRADSKRKRTEKLVVPEYANASSNGIEDLLPNRAPLFDLNEISVGDEDIQNNVEPVKNMEASTSVMCSHGENLQNELKLLLCRNAGEGSSSRVAKRKISWQDPVAVRV